MRYIIAKSGVESLLTTKEVWDKHPDEYLDVVLEFEASSMNEAEKIYNSQINSLSIKKHR